MRLDGFVPQINAASEVEPQEFYNRAMMEACTGGNLEDVIYALDCGAELEARHADFWGRTVLE